MSKRKGGIELIADAEAAHAYASVMANHSSLNGCDSPIESIMLAAIKHVFHVNFWFVEMREFHPEEAGHIFRVDDFQCYVWLARQVQIDNYRVDFLVRLYASEERYADLIVECDGHDFHERTKEQARNDRSRDRALQELKYPVYRFTGSEIWADPIKCANQVWAWAREADRWE